MGLFHWFFVWVAKRAFHRVDADKNGRLDPIEVEVAVLHVYNIINKRLPGWQDPPSSKEVKKAVQVFGGGAGFLDEGQFVEFARTLVKNGPDTFFRRVGTNAVLRTGVMPGITYMVKKYAGEMLRVQNVPAVVLAPALGVLTGSIRGLLPFG
mmetsp:Transcript_11196/g.33582  ORF Transcript_11196/g.33582 Transcript_11196/m.33582 type:complete len:152 (+) Transcript_11196:298-753(+)